MSSFSFKRATYCHWIIVLWIVCTYILSTNCLLSDRRDRSQRIFCKKPDPIPNGEVRLKRNGASLRHLCNLGYTLLGPRNTACVKGKWYGDRPVCAKSGCNAIMDSPANGKIQLVNQYKVAVYCLEGYNLAGNRFAYCNGTQWDRKVGECRKRQDRIEHECDFETDDICGWVFDHSDSFQWRRVMAANVFTSFQTGPRHDHTTMSASGGHYMLMESYGNINTTIALTSPIYSRDLSLKTACCFRFYYFMYGSGVGDLDVFVKPASLTLTQMLKNIKDFAKFHKSGNQNNIWNEAHFNIDEMGEDFQIVFVASGAKSHLSDIAIDDVKLMTGAECKSLDRPEEGPDDSSEYETTTTEETLFDMQSCVSRCGIDAAGVIRRDNKLIGICSCHLRCLLDDDCCPDFDAICLNGDGANGDPEGNADDLSTVTEEVFAGGYVDVTNSATARSDNATIAFSSATTATTITKPTTVAITSTTRKPSTTTTATKPPITAAASTTKEPLITKKTTPKKLITTTKMTTVTTKKSSTSTTTTTISSTAPTLKTTAKATVTVPKTTATTTLTRERYPTSIYITTTLASTQAPAVLTTDAIQLTTGKAKMKRINATKLVFTWDNKAPTDYATKNRGSTVLLVLFAILLAAIIVGAIYRHRKAAIAGWLEHILKKGHNDTGEEDSRSIIANFTPQDNPCSSGTGNHMNFSKPDVNRKTKQIPSKDDRHSLSDDQPFDCLNDNDSIPLL